MNRLLQYANIIGVVALLALCVMQWNANRREHLENISLQKTGLELSSRLAEQQRTLKGQAADLDTFREQIARNHNTLKETEKTLATTQRDIAQLEAEREQLKTSVTNWAAAVAARDERIKESNERIRYLSDNLNTNIAKFNELAEKYSRLVKNWNAL